jgi:hypothetical protein
MKGKILRNEKLRESVTGKFWCRLIRAADKIRSDRGAVKKKKVDNLDNPTM